MVSQVITLLSFIWKMLGSNLGRDPVLLSASTEKMKKTSDPISNIALTLGSFKTIDIVACGPVAGQRQRDKQIHKRRY
jgi:hypothetical protein